MFYQIFLSLQVKRCSIITYNRGISQLSHELPNNLRLEIQKLRNIRKVSKLQKMVAKCQVPLSRGAIFHMKTRVSLVYPVNDCG